MIKIINNRQIGTFLVILGVILGFFVWYLGYEIVNLIIKLFAIWLIVMGILLIITSNSIVAELKNGKNRYLVDGMVRLIIGIVILIVDLGLISSIIGIIYLIYLIIEILSYKDFTKAIKKYAIQIIVAIVLISSWVDNILVWALRIFDIIIIIYGIILLISANNDENKLKKVLRKDTINSEFVEAEFVVDNEENE